MDIQQVIEKLKIDKRTASERLKEYVQDKTVPLEKRWQLFIDSNLGDHDDSVIHQFENVPKWKEWARCTIDDVLFEYVNRGALIKMEDLDIQIHDMIGRQFELDGATYETRDEKRNVTFSQEDLNEWRENVLKSFVKSFAFVW